MGTKQQLLLLLALGAVQLSQAAHQVAWETSSQTGYRGYLTTVSGTVKSDEGCAPPAANRAPVKALQAFCKPLDQAEVTVNMTGVGELYAVGLSRSAPAAATIKVKPVNKSSNSPAVKATPVEPQSVTVSTDADGKFVAYVMSTEEGTSTLKASAVVADSTQESGDLSLDWVAPVYTFDAFAKYPADSVSSAACFQVQQWCTSCQSAPVYLAVCHDRHSKIRTDIHSVLQQQWAAASTVLPVLPAQWFMQKDNS